jgi:cob(I)alamin adenosyltransferase
MPNNLNPALIQVYTGNGKGKTTAALGLGLRAAGHGLKVALIQFLKGQPTGELDLLAKFPLFSLVRAGSLDSFKAPAAELTRESAEILQFAGEEMLSGSFDLIILDEINVAMQLGYLSTKAVLDFVDKKPEGTELILTGRGAPAEIIERADLVTEMRPLKHPYQKGIRARPGIEY